MTCFGRINNIRNKIESLRLLWDIVVYRLLRICKIRSVESYIYTFWYNFDTVLYQFLETGTSDRTLICLNQLHEIFRFQPIPLFIFPLQSFKEKNIKVIFSQTKVKMGTIVIQTCHSIDCASHLKYVYSPL